MDEQRAIERLRKTIDQVRVLLARVETAQAHVTGGLGALETVGLAEIRHWYDSISVVLTETRSPAFLSEEFESACQDLSQLKNRLGGLLGEES